MLAQHSEMKVDRLLWMIFEGNDLEDSYDDLALPVRRLENLLPGTLAQLVLAMPARLRDESVVDRLLTGRSTVSAPWSARRPWGDRGPVYQHRVFGPMAFVGGFQAVVQSESYVLRHPHRPALDRTLEGMAALAKSRDFRVALLLAPSAARLYAADCEGAPVPSARPYFLDYVAAQGRRLGFEVVDLVPPLR
jgi:hypothetical protein